MSRYFQGFYPVLAGLIGLVLFGTAFLPHPVLKHTLQYSIDPSSKLYLEGTSNVNSFQCFCEDRYAAQRIEMEARPPVNRFRNAHLAITTKRLNCRNGKINRDMYTALRADDFPAIRMELRENWYEQKLPAEGSNAWFRVKADTRLTITDVTRDEKIHATARRVSKNTIEVRGKKEILMSHYGIDPPEAMFGMIKVNDLITLHFNLVVHVDPGSEF
jgi:hypothetical protein